MGPLRLFVYGTLKRGGRYHQRFCSGALSIEPASVRGRLHTLPAGYPVLVVPPDTILAHGSRDAIADVVRQAIVVGSTATITVPRPTGARERGSGWQDVQGELQTFDDPAERLAAIDALEGFHPGAPSLYLRVLLPVDRNAGCVAAWAYVEPSQTANIDSGGA